jgi:hypothetical protein
MAITLGAVESLAGLVQVGAGLVITNAGFRHYGPAVALLGAPLATLGLVRLVIAVVTRRRAPTEPSVRREVLALASCRLCERLGPGQVAIALAFAIVSWVQRKGELGTTWALSSDAPIAIVTGLGGAALTVALFLRMSSRGPLASRVTVITAIVQLVCYALALAVWAGLVFFGFMMGAIGGGLGKIH